jgi:6-phosphogluconolactonase
LSLPALRRHADPATLVDALLPAVAAVATQAIGTRGRFDLVLAGGSTPRALYAALARAGLGNADWHIWYGDERCLAPEDPERNSHMAEVSWLGDSAIPPSQRQAIPAERGPEAAAAAYTLALSAISTFDLVLLGMGEDGHTASLFPGQAAGLTADAPAAIPVHDAPKPPPDRVSLSAARLSQSQRVWFLATGAGKTPALRAWAGADALPVAHVKGLSETLLWLDAAAWP